MKLNRLLVLATLAGLLQACASAPPKVKEVAKPAAVTEVPEPAAAGATGLIEQAKHSYIATGDLGMRNSLLLRAADKFLQEQNPRASLKLLQLLLPELTDAQQIAIANLFIAESYVQKQGPLEVQIKAQLVERIDVAQLSDMQLHQRYFGLQRQLQFALGNWLAAADATLKSNLSAQQQTREVWQLVRRLDTDKLEKARLKYVNLQPWLQLAWIAQQHGLDANALKQASNAWTSRNAAHPLAQKLPEEIINAMQAQPLQLSKIAVLLPLSGRLQNQGEAIKEGILASHFASMAEIVDAELLPNIQYIDSAALSTDEIVKQVESADIIIGPLLKQTLTQLLPLLPSDKPILALNQLDKDERVVTAAEAYYFSLSPENEAKQLAEFVFDRGHRQPAIIGSNSNIGQRMSKAFLSRWQELNPNPASQAKLTLFTDNKDMRNKVSARLDVKQSQQRIKSIERLMKEELHAVARNRQDLDAMVVFADPEQTQLLNPMVESSISPFSAAEIPIYASSRSHKITLNNAALRDLRNLTFSDMPWMLPNKSWQQLKRETLQIWQNRADNHLRLFALGYDAYQLIPHLRQLKTLPGLSVAAMSGQLSVTSAGEVTRQLSFGRFSESRVELVAME